MEGECGLCDAYSSDLCMCGCCLWCHQESPVGHDFRRKTESLAYHFEELRQAWRQLWLAAWTPIVEPILRFLKRLISRQKR